MSQESKRKLEVNFEKKGQVSILNMKGHLTTDHSKIVLDSFAHIAQEDLKRVLLNFSDVEYINSSGISVLIQLLKTAKEKGANIEFCGLNSHVQRVFDVIGFKDIVPMHQNLKDALI